MGNHSGKRVIAELVGIES